MLKGLNDCAVQTQKPDILADPDSGDAYLAGKVAFVLGLAGFDHPGVFLGSKDGVSVGWSGLRDSRRLRLELEGDRKDFLREPVRGAILDDHAQQALDR